ncbi:hypothetical protein N657DRAFT_638230 [Parathielavia appendiculata]|uniref:Uncharacterized protein n=1 Tax=Parathielavia appendiculata TaxID=2587402 RepID=A0AAN6TPC6_9PEZI|nr:hypothetical protein N657DRAFT_638230 [Parathielavia appendiculata]
MYCADNRYYDRREIDCYPTAKTQEQDSRPGGLVVERVRPDKERNRTDENGEMKRDWRGPYELRTVQHPTPNTEGKMKNLVPYDKHPGILQLNLCLSVISKDERALDYLKGLGSRRDTPLHASKSAGAYGSPRAQANTKGTATAIPAQNQNSQQPS